MASDHVDLNAPDASIGNGLVMMNGFSASIAARLMRLTT